MTVESSSTEELDDTDLHTNNGRSGIRYRGFRGHLHAATLPPPPSAVPAMEGDIGAGAWPSQQADILIKGAVRGPPRRPAVAASAPALGLSMRAHRPAWG